MQVIAIGAGAVLGANLRYFITLWATNGWGAEFPAGTLLVNVSGAFAIGVLLAFLNRSTDIDPLWRLFLATGFLGGYTTFSTYAWEALTLAKEGAVLRALVYVGGSNLLAFLGVWVGSLLASVRA